MPRAEAGTSKAIGNAMKSKGLQKLRWYCQICEKQCRDDNGFKCHTMSEGHLRQMLVVGESAGKHIADYTSRFQGEFVALLSRRWGTKRVRVNQVYQEYIQDKNHLHMNATRFLSLTEFAKHLGRTGVCHVDETEKGWFISWIDNSPKALAKAEANQKKERGEMDDEMRQRKLIQEQIERAREEGERRRKETLLAKGGQGESGEGETGEEAKPVEEEEPTRELKREEGEKVALSLNFKATPTESTSKAPSPPTTDSAPPAPASTFIAPPVKPVIGFTPKPNPLAAKRPNPLKANPLAKKSNPLKSGSSGSSTSTTGGEKRKAPMSAMEQIAMEEMARKQRRRD
ncbi:Rts2p [Sporobolomyces salmoneus]|uniref:Rts2p n=1 Tax=Sporobolomyces salmoneus TaxID=183962 RepID=UPI0031701B2A